MPPPPPDRREQLRRQHRPAPRVAETPHSGVRDHDIETLRWLCDDDFGIVDVDPNGQPKVIRHKADWSQWFHELFSTLEALGADTDSEIISYKAVREQSLGYSVVEFRQSLTVGDHTARFDCIATIVWKKTNHGWREARWHGSVISSEIPDELRDLAETAA